MTDTIKQIKEAKKRLRPLHNRMDADVKLANLDKYTLKSAITGKDIEGAVSVTMPEPKIYLNSTISSILSLRKHFQTVIEGGIPSTTKRKIESYSDDCYYDVDERLVRQKKQKLFTFWSTHICARGWIGARWLWVNDPEYGFYLDCLPIDARYCYYDLDDDGFAWFANETRRSSVRIKEQYGIDVGEGDGMVLDFWNDKVNEIYVGKEGSEDFTQVDERDNPYSYPPFVLVPAPEGFLFFDKDYISREGESVFFLDRDMYKHWNQLVSIDQTLALGSIDPAYQMEVEETTGEKAPIPPLTSATVEVKKGSKYELIPRPDVNKAVGVAHDHIERAIQMGSPSDIDVAVPPRVTSALWITEQEGLREKVRTPRLEAMESAYQQSTRMIIDQYIQGKFSGKLGRRGAKTLYSYTELGDPETYDIKYKILPKSKRQDIANLTIARVANPDFKLSIKTTMEDIVSAEDPEGEIARIEAEEAEKINPVLKLLRMAYSTSLEAQSLHGDEKEVKQLQAIELTWTMYNLIQNPQPTPTEGKEKIPARQLLPLLNEGRAGKTIPTGGEVE